MKNKLSLIIFLFLTQSLLAQETTGRRTERDAKKQERRDKIDNLIRQQEEGALVFNKQNVYGLRLNSDGWSVFFEKGILKSVTVTNLYGLEIGEKKNKKENKVPGQAVSDGFFIFSTTPYRYGKQNIFYQVKPFIGQQRHVGGKTNKNGVAVQAIYGGGISLGLERPYYIKVEDPNTSEVKDIKYSVADSALFLNPTYILQGTGLRHGWNDMKIVPGVHAKAALRFDYGRFNELVSAIEVGLNVEAYSRKVNIMLLNPGKQLFFNSYIAILLGKRK